MLTALVRRPGPALERCALTHLERRPIDLDRARVQHGAYCEALAALGLELVHLPPLDDAPDACFVEDAAVVLDDVAVIARPAFATRRRELASVAAALTPFRETLRIEAPATLEGGDVLVVEDVAYVGWSGRTNHAGLKALAHLLLPYGLRVKAVEVRGCLHLKTALARVGPRTLLANLDWVNLERVQGFEVLRVHPDEPMAANALCAGDGLLYPTGNPRTEARLRERGLEPYLVELSELQKAEAGATCLSVIFEAGSR